MDTVLTTRFCALGFVFLTGCAHPNLNPPALFAADRAFAKMAMNKGIQAAFTEYADDYATVLKQHVEIGKGAVKSTFAGMENVVLVWEPQGGELSSDGEIGWTWGTWKRWLKTDPNKSTTGRYLTVWRRSKDGSYRWSADLGDADP
jgi:ketosteroid isomerase-like protein